MKKKKKKKIEYITLIGLFYFISFEHSFECLSMQHFYSKQNLKTLNSKRPWASKK